MSSNPGSSAAACPHGDPSCPCPDGDVCHYKDDPKSETLAMACWSPDCTVKEPHERA